MAQVNFYLKDPKAKEETPIYLFFSFDNQRLKYAISKSIHPKHWNKENQKVREKLDATNYSTINSLLKSLGEVCENEYLTAKSKGVRVTPEYMREKLNGFLYKGVEKEKDFFDYLHEFMEAQSIQRAYRTIQKYKTLEQHLLNFQRDKKYKITFDSIDAIFYEKFMGYYIQDLKVLNNTTGKYISSLKSFLHWATERKYNTNLGFVKFKAINTCADIIYLTNEELMSIYELDLSANKRLDQVRDSFCLGCFTGLRHSDITAIRRANVKGENIIMTSFKTKEQLEIPLNDFSKEILKKYNYQLPAISNQKFNDYIKEIGEKAEIIEPIILTKYRGAKAVKYEKPKWEFLSSHCGRRTFVTLSLEKGMRAETVMSITGHKNYKTFKKYIKITSKVKAVEMKQVWKKEELLKVVRMKECNS
jgi:integrase